MWVIDSGIIVPVFIVLFPVLNFRQGVVLTLVLSQDKEWSTKRDNNRYMADRDRDNT